MGDDERPGDEREDILSILRELRPFYFWILIVQVAIWGAMVIWAERGNCANVDFSNCAVAVGLKMSGLIPLWFFTSVVLVDIGRFLMVFLPDLRGRIRDRAWAEGRAEGRSEGRSEGRAEGRAEGRSEGRSEGRAEGRSEGEAIGVGQMHAKWSAWNQRRLEAERNGEPFDEPPPAPND